MKVTPRKEKSVLIFVGIIGICTLVGGSVLLGFFERIVRFFMKKEMILKPGNEFFKIWRDVPIPIYQKLYLFNITNPDKFVYEGEKPILKELGPYVYKGRWMKENIEWNDDDGTVTYKDVKDYEFVPELSYGDQQEIIYTLNAPLLAVINYVEDFSPIFFRSFVVDIMNGIFDSYNETLLVHKTVKELIYEGYHEPMVSDLVKVIEPFIDLPLKLINDTFGILHEKKHVGDGVFTVKSGIKGLEDYGSIKLWNNQSMVKWWDGDSCNQISGTDGVQYSPGISRNETLTLFNPNLCRSIPLKYEKDITVHGIKTLRFGIPSDTFATGDINPDNKCYCSGKHCRSGILPLNCKKGAPYAISLPHFFEGDPELGKGVIGVNASSELHKTFVDVEPNTGVVLNAAVKVELNGVVRHLPEYKVLETVGDHIVPVLWMSEEATLDAHFANYFKTKVQMPIILFRAISIGIVVIGAVWTASAFCILMCFDLVKSDSLKHSVVLKTANSVYTSVALWPPKEEKEGTVSEKTRL